MAAAVALAVLIAFALGYRFYARFVGRRVFGDDEEIRTPAHEFEDGQDYVPTHKHILFGHHFTSIAGAAPIIGPCVAAYWGWLPALLWVVLGVIFMGAVHDYGALIVSAREKGRTIADITAKVINGRARLMFLCFVLVLSWLVLAVFALAITGLFMATPTSVLPVNIEIIVAIVIGWLIYKKGVGALVPSLIALAILYLFVWIGASNPISLADIGIADRDTQKTTWILLLFVYSSIASLLPVWLLLQPRDFINSHQLIVGLALLFGGLFVAQPAFDAPAIRDSVPGGPQLFPLLFVTVACGAISGFHGLVSSGTTSKQLNSMRDARAIGYGAMLGEGCLALAATIAAAAGLGLVGELQLGDKLGIQGDCSWAACYEGFPTTAGAVGNFVNGGSAMLYSLGLGAGIAKTLMAVLVISFAATTLDTATRIERFLVTEIGHALKIAPLQNRVVATVVAVAPALPLALWKVENPVTGQITEAGRVLWPIFGASNQMLAALTLMVLSLYFWRRGRNVLPLVIPMLFLMGITLLSLVLETKKFFGQKNWLLFCLTLVLSTLILWMIFEGLALVARIRRERADDSP